MINNPTPIEKFDPFANANDPTIPEPKTFDLWGEVEMNLWICVLTPGIGKELFSPDLHKTEQAHTAIDVFIIPLTEVDVKYPKNWECHWVADDYKNPAWKKITLPSIIDAGLTSIKSLCEKLDADTPNPEYVKRWARVSRVPSFRKFPAKDAATGQLTGEMKSELTFKFIQFFDTKDACRAAYITNGGTPANGHVAVQTGTPDDTEKATNLAFLKVIVTNAARGKTDLGEAKDAVGVALLQYPTVAKYFTVDSDETVALINETLKV